MSNIETTPTEEPQGVIAQLEAHKKKAEALGPKTTTLPETGIKVSWPAFLSHSLWMRAQRMARKAPTQVGDYYVVLACRFGGERLTMEQYQSLVPANDALHLTGEVLGDDEGEAGNA